MLKLIGHSILIASISGTAGASEFIPVYKGTRNDFIVSRPSKPKPREATPAVTDSTPIKVTTPKKSKPIVLDDNVAPPSYRGVVVGATDFEEYLPEEDTSEGYDSDEIVNLPDNDTPVPIPEVKPKPKPKPKPTPVVPPVDEGANNDNNDNNDNYSDDQSDDGEDSSEIVAPIPHDRPDREDEVAVTPDKPATPAATTLYDSNLKNCDYRENCWSNSTSDKIKANMKKIISNVAFLNSLHKVKFDPRYFLCTGWRESTYNPGAKGGAGERGMFQVMAETGVAALKAGGPPLLQDFKNYRSKPETYMNSMAKSSLAQTEMSFMVLKMKIKEAKGAGQNLDDILTGRASVATYKKLAKRYNGAGSAAEKYSIAISQCLDCMRKSDGLPDVTKDFNYTSVDGCLAMAKKNH